MYVITVGHVKGGVGKTTTAVQLALHAAATGRRTTLIDADPGRSALSWSARATNWPTELVPVVAHHRPDLDRTARVFGDGSDLVIIDAPHDPFGGAQVGAELATAIAAADLLVVPTSPLLADLDRLEDLRAAVNREQARRPLDWILVLARVDLRRKTIAAEVAELLVNSDWPVLPIAVPSALAGGHATSTWVPMRAAVGDAFGTAEVLPEYDGLFTAVMARLLAGAEVTA